MLSVIVMLLSVFCMVIVQYLLREVFFHRKMEGVSVGDGLVFPVDGYHVYTRLVEPGKVYSTKLGENMYAGEVKKKSVHVGVYMTIFDRHHVISP